MKKYIFIVIVLVSYSNLFSQNRIEFKIGAEYRITPIQKSHIGIIYSDIPVFYSEYRQLTGTAFNYTLSYVLKNNFGFGLSQSFQYSHIYYKDDSTESVNGIINDFKLFITKNIYLTNNTILFIEIGESLMNSGTAYSTKELVSATGSNGEPLYFTGERDFSYFSTNVTIGIIKNNFDSGIGAYFSDEADNFAKKTKFILPYLKLNYIIIK